MADIYAFSRLHTDLHDEQYVDLAHRLIEIGIDVYDFESNQEAQIVEEIEERERGSIRENTQIYMRDVGEYDLLSRDDELTYARAMNQAMSDALASIAPVKSVNLQSRKLISSHVENDQLNRLLAGFLDHVEDLPEVERPKDNGSSNEREDSLDRELARRRIQLFESASDEYFALPVNKRTSEQQITVEESFRFFKFHNKPLYIAFWTPLRRAVRSIESAIARARSICLTAGISDSAFLGSIYPRLTAPQVSDVIVDFPVEIQANLKAHMHVIERVHKSLKTIEEQCDLSYIELLERDQLLNSAIQRFREAKNALVSGNLRLVMRVAQNI